MKAKSSRSAIINNSICRLKFNDLDIMAIHVPGCLCAGENGDGVSVLSKKLLNNNNNKVNKYT
jgi:hypothetical protein